MAGALVGGAFLSAFLQVAFDRLTSPKILDYFQERKLNVRLLRKLTITLTSINAVLDAEDLLEEIETQVSQQELEAEMRATSSKVLNLSTTLASASVNQFSREIELRIEEVLGQLEYLEKKRDVLRMKEYGIDVGARVGGKLSQRLSTSLVDETKVYGRYADKDIIMNLFFSVGVNVSCLSVVLIVAIGGMGKTTLAQLVYNDGRVIDHFDLKAWIYVSDEFDAISLTKTFLRTFIAPANEFEDLNILQLQLKLKDRLIKKKFLLILDDVWNENSTRWELLLCPLIFGAPRSKVLVTTRSERVAEVMHSISIHQLRPLGEEEGWKLFCRHAFGSRDSNANPDLEAIGRKIVDKCKGLPLAIKILGGEFCYRLENDNIKNIPKKTCHMSCSRNIDDVWTIFQTSYKYSNLRTFMSQQEMKWESSINLQRNSLLVSQINKMLHDLTPRLKHLRVLSLYESIVIELSDFIGTLKHLHYLDLSFMMIEKLPDSTCKLHNLQTFKLAFCENFLGEFPKGMHKLVNSPHFDFLGTKIKENPLHFGRLKHLQTLTAFYVGKCSESGFKQLGQLNQLRGSLPILELQNVIDPMDGIEANLKEKEYIEELVLKWSGEDEDEDSQKDINVLERLQPHKNLKKLHVINYCGTRFLDWIGDCYRLPE
ncbi:Disease resistance protein [Quillaja saponaria]|uniref:Disease resistance protein n=1 Tax=Quillaja saponaria TaxID=32244 RepID=A0AAD7LS02_QUISA|nr:Disease resistance protein [Quillaja saponaria]